MNHHFRSYSEHQPAVLQHQQLSQSNSIIKIHSDSQQSLDRLFNPEQSAVPLRERQLPKSFFNPGYKANGNDSPANNDSTTNNNNNNNNHNNQNQVHCRSMSFDQRQVGHNNFHIRTTSTLAPMPVLTASSNHSSHQSSNEFSSYANTNTSSSANGGWSSSGNSMDDIMSTNCELNPQPSAIHQHTAVQAQQVVAPGPPTGSVAPTQSQTHLAYGSLQHQQPQQQTMQPQQLLNHHNNNQHNHHHHQNHLNHHQHQQHHQAAVYQQSTMQPVQQPQQQASSTHNLHGHHQHHQTVYNAPGMTDSNDNRVSATLGHSCTNQVPTNANSMHCRSMSFGTQPHQPIARVNQANFHMRTQSTVLTPMPSSDLSTTHSSHQSSHEFLNYPNQTDNATNRWSSSGYSTDDLTGANWVPGQPQQVHAQPVQQTMMQPQTLQHQQHSLPISQQLNQAPQQLFYNVV